MTLQNQAVTAYGSATTHPPKSDLSAIWEFVVKTHTDTSAMVADADLTVGEIVETADGQFWDIVSAGTHTADAETVFNLTAGQAVTRRAPLYLNVQDFGVLPRNTGADNSTNFDTAITMAAAKEIALMFPVGTYEFDRKPIIKSNLKLVDPSYGGAVLKLSDTAGDDESLLCGPMVGDADMTLVENVSVVGFTLDGNHARTATIGDLRPGGTGAAAGYVKDWTFYRTKGHGWKLHCFDICNGGELDGSGERVYSDGDETAVGVLRSQGVQLIECEAWDAGDDAFTIHFADNWLVKGCKARDASGRHPSLNGGNMFEADDGAGPGAFIDNIALGPANTGFAVKCHDGYPAPHGVLVQGNIAQGVARGFYLNDPNTAGPSPTAKGVSFIGNICRAPAFFDKPGGLKSDTDITGFSIGEYSGVVVSGNTAIGGGAFLSETALDGGALDRQTESAFEFESGAKFSCTGNVAIDWAGDNITDTGVCGFKQTSTATGLFSGNMSVNCGWRGFVTTGGDTNSSYMGNIAILDAALAGSVAFRFSNEGEADPDGIIGNRADGLWEFAMSISEDDFADMRDFTGAGNVNSAFYSARETDLAMNTATEFNADAFGFIYDTMDDFLQLTGTFTARQSGLHLFNAMVAFSEGDGVDDTCALGFRKTDALAAVTDFAQTAINPRSNTTAGVEDTTTIEGGIMLNRGDTVNLVFSGMSATTPVIAKEIHFSGRIF